MYDLSILYDSLYTNSHTIWLYIHVLTLSILYDIIILTLSILLGNIHSIHSVCDIPIVNWLHPVCELIYLVHVYILTSSTLCLIIYLLLSRFYGIIYVYPWFEIKMYLNPCTTESAYTTASISANSNWYKYLDYFFLTAIY